MKLFPNLKGKNLIDDKLVDLGANSIDRGELITLKRPIVKITQNIKLFSTKEICSAFTSTSVLNSPEQILSKNEYSQQ